MLIDTTTYNLMHSIENPTTTIATKIISIIFDPLTLTIIALAISVYLFIKSQKKQSVFFVTTILITDLIIKLSKEIIQRARPLNAIIQETSYAFPSGHATMSVVFLGLIIYIFTKKKKRKTKIIAMLITTLAILTVAISRIYLRVHWLTDVIAGIILGTIILAISIIIHKKSNLS